MIRLPFWDDRRRRRRWLSSLLGRPSLKMGSTLSFFLFLFFTNLFLFFLSLKKETKNRKWTIKIKEK
jgi:hypothetical protein